MAHEIDSGTVRRALKRAKRKLREHRAKDLEQHRARFSAASEDAVSRVLMLEELLEPEEDATSAD